MNFPSLKAVRANGDERFMNGSKALDVDLLAFWRWYASDLASNATRGCLAEFIVAHALRHELKDCRDEWAVCDLELVDGTKIEVKSAAYWQAWAQSKRSPPTFSIRKARAWDKVTGKYFGEAKRHANVYVFALLAHEEKATLNPRDVGQWRFFVAATTLLDARLSDAKSTSPSGLRALGVSDVSFDDLSSAVHAARGRP